MAQAGAQRVMTGDGSSVPHRAQSPGDASGPASASEYPVREYVGAMSAELARMARWDGDERLALLLEIAARLAADPRDDARP